MHASHQATMKLVTSTETDNSNGSQCRIRLNDDRMMTTNMIDKINGGRSSYEDR